MGQWPNIVTNQTQRVVTGRIDVMYMYDSSMGAEASSVRLFQSVIAFRKKYSFVYSVPQEGTGNWV